MKEITASVYQLQSTKGSYAYLYMSREGPVLIDTSFPHRAVSIIRELEAQHVRPEYILITHYDIDHIGNLAPLAEHFRVQVFLPVADAPYITGNLKRPGIKRLFGFVVHVKVPSSFKTITAEDRVAGVMAIASPGHTPGHLAYYVDGVLFAGDAIGTRGDLVKSNPRMLTWNIPQEESSRQRLLANFRGWICPAHGEPVTWPPQLNG